ncbi:efflux RND transporter permease subunit [Xanthomonas sp. NCPPB 2654]|uniref:efflux RND transporter permease subunit n=1 Tax=unclassified Xanthomonas TaxID=2643310 RepID=UPI0021DF4FF3|nr:MULTISPECIES: efflux RND transporter permease subunit [unclassified Xanthomonas]MDL5365597.1 efflux RND transporter permease subunit [Xanthomonas sp. NCPPB 2654]UYC18782.1 efflux RND transporter permease subunit [Xanthomonas sp. CFBP 8443]
MSAATWPIRHPTPVVLLFLLLALAGWVGFRDLPVQDLPEIDLPTINIALVQPGGSPLQLESEVARPVEDALTGLVGLRHVRSTVFNGMVRVSAQFEIGKPLQEALTETKEAVDRMRSTLPSTVLPPSVSAELLGSSPILGYAVQAKKMDEQQLSWFVDDVLAKTLRVLPGVGRVARVGGVEREVRVELDPARMAALGVSAAEVSRAIGRVQQQAAGGTARLGGETQALRTVATVQQARELEQLPIPLADGRWLRLEHVARIVDGPRDRSSAALLDGKAVVGMDIYRARGRDETRVAAAVEQALSELAQRYPEVVVTRVAGSVDYTQEQFDGSMQLLLEGALLAVLVVWWFLRDWRATAVAAMALPLSILPTFALMPWLGFSLNTLTLLALAVVAGILVDDAIVEIENIERHRRLGKPLREATADAVSEIAVAVIATTLTLVAVFLPTALMPGISGLLFAQFGWTTVIAVLASLLVARLLTPLLAVHWLADAPAVHCRESAWVTWYRTRVAWCLQHRTATLLLAAAVLIASLALLPLIPTGFIPPAEQGYVQIGVESPPGTSLERSTAMAERVRQAVADLPGVVQVFTSIGGTEGDAGMSVSETRRAVLTITLAKRGQRPPQPALEQQIRDRLATLPGVRVTVGGNAPGGEVALILASNDPHLLAATARSLEREMRGVRGLANVTSSASLEQPELVVRPMLGLAVERGVETQALADTVRIALGGDYDTDLPRLTLDSRQLLIRTQLPQAARSDLDTLTQLRVPGRHGPVPLGSVASVAMESGPYQLERFDRQRYVTLSASLAGLALGQANAAIAALPTSQARPKAVTRIETGDAELAAEMAGGLIGAIAAGIVCMYCVLVLLFKDAFQPITILSAVPLSLGGAFAALLLSSMELNVPSMIGLIMLMGIVTKNSILLVDHAEQALRNGQASSPSQAIAEAAAQRARPIVMTSLAMIAGMLPIALGLGADASFRQPMAITVIGGLVTSTVLSLLVVPVLFVSIAELRRRVVAVMGNARRGGASA